MIPHVSLAIFKRARFPGFGELYEKIIPFIFNNLIFSLFEMVVKYFDAFLNLIPLSFVLGFYVSYVASRWWQQFLAIPWPDK